MGLSQVEIASRMRVPIQCVNTIIKGRRATRCDIYKAEKLLERAA